MGVKFDLTGLHNLQKIQTGGTHTRQAMTVIGTLYLAMVRKRFNKFSRGGGDWPELSPQTVKRKGGSEIILKDTGLLFNALSPGAKGSLKQLKGNKAIRVGFANITHEAGSSVTYQKLATFHDEGAGDLPQRKIFVSEIPEDTKERMRNALRKMIEKQATQG